MYQLFSSWVYLYLEDAKKEKKKGSSNLLTSFTCSGLIYRRSCWMVVKICVRRLSSQSWRIILKKYPRPRSSKSCLFFELNWVQERVFTAILETKLSLLALYFQYLSAKTLDAARLSNQKFSKWYWMFAFVTKIVRATFPTRHSRTSPYGHFPYTHASIFTLFQAEVIKSLPLYILRKVHMVLDQRSQNSYDLFLIPTLVLYKQSLSFKETRVHT